MSMSTHIIGIKPPDERWKKMKAIWDACKEAGISVPREVSDFFDNCAPDPAGVVVELTGRPWRGNAADGFEIDLPELDPDIRTIRFYNSY